MLAVDSWCWLSDGWYR